MRVISHHMKINCNSENIISKILFRKHIVINVNWDVFFVIFCGEKNIKNS